MKKIIIAAFIALLTLAAFGCSANQPAPSKQQNSSEQPVDKVVKKFKPYLGGIKLGDSKEQVIQAFGSDYKQTVYDEELSLGEPFAKLRYDNGIIVVLGLNSNSVLEIESSFPAVTNNLGVKIGDKAREVLNKYRSKYKEAESNQGEGKMIGWFLINDKQELVIFNFEKGESLGNINVKPDSQLERIKLTNFKYMD